METWRRMFLTVVAFLTLCVLGNAKIKLKDNGYEGVTIVIKNGVKENPDLLTRLQDVFTETSKKMYKATKNRAYLRDITVVVPKSWDSQPHFETIPAVTSKMQLIIVDKRKKGRGRAPYVLGNSLCGKGGLLMHITPDFLLTEGETPYGLHDNVLLHEWGHFRWGLFDEYPSVIRRSISEEPDKPRPKDYIQFYRSQGKWEPVRCTRNVRGFSYLKCDRSKPCDVDTAINIPDKCRFCPTKDQGTRASMMGVQWLPMLDSFCDRDHWETDPALRHDSRAPNLQNRVCRGRSAWEVMRKHKDFKESNLAGDPDVDTTPNFLFVQPVGRVVVFVLDVSGSMNDNKRLRRMQQAVQLVIQTLVERGCRVAIVQFNTDGTIVADIREIKNNKDRTYLIDKIPKDAQGGTSIGAGLLKALEVLDNNGIRKKGCDIILVSDGENTHKPSIDDVTDDIIKAKVTVHTVAVSQHADSGLAQLAQATGGRHLTFLESEKISFADAMKEVIAPDSALADEESAETLFSDGFSVGPDAAVNDVFVIDGALGNSTTVTVMAEDETDISLQISASGLNFQFEDSRQATDMAVFNILGTPLAGEYHFTVETTKQTKINVYVTSKPTSSDVEVLRVTSWISESTIDFTGSEPSILFTEVQKGGQPVLGATVEAILESGATNSYSFEMKDSGTGADTVQDDGVYSAYLLPSYFSGNGRYNTKIKVKGDDSAYIWSSAIGSRSVINPDYAEEEDEEETVEYMDEFQRLSLPGEITLTNYNPNTGDITPPARITDLQIEEIVQNFNSDQSEQTVTYTFSWSAVGDDLDSGAASYYDWRMDTDIQKLLNDVPSAAELNATDAKPKPSGQLDSLTLTFGKDDCNGTCYLGLRAVDESGLHGDMSNIVSIEVEFPRQGQKSSANSVTAHIYTVILMCVGFVSVRNIYSFRRV